MSVEAHKETLGFQTEVNQLLKLMIHSLYSNKEIFLRELVSNASDAIDKLRFEAISESKLYENDTELKISLSFDKDARTITISDNGIGMSRDEVVENIGTIAKSGTRQFLDSLTGDQKKDANAIGQFGVGFYSSFIIADKVSLCTRRAGTAGDQAVLWESAGEGDFSIETVEKSARGTEITLHLREGEDEFLDGTRLRTIVRKYSDHITVPIEMLKEAMPPMPTEEGEAPEEVEDVIEYEVVNSASALWTRSKNDISEEEYTEFYKHVGHDFEEPLARSHNQVEGKYEYTSLLFIPKRAPFDMWDRERQHGIKLYVRRVFIMDETEKLMPNYLRFVKGVIDSNDLPLNVSREILQNSKVLDNIRSGSVKKVLTLLQKMANNDKENYQTFWKEFGRVIKEGPGEDFANRDKIAKLIRFSSTMNDKEDQEVSLDDYLSRMQEGQKDIYYITADSFAAAKNSPHLEVFRKKGIEVLLLTDRVDEFLMSSLPAYEEKNIVSVARGELDLGDMENEDEKKEQEKTQEEYKDFLKKVTDSLGDDIKEVRMTHRLTDSPACLVTGEHDMSANLERLLQQAGQDVMGHKPIFELNPEHPLIKRLSTDVEGERFDDWTRILFEQALLSEGGQLDDPATFVSRLNKMLLELTS
ncbi:MAG: molecular chaperone HtpG [gamma proteobacterium symbiont of Bathyaustriella thionipta]|nr:molecular chaperone HtpG [gamma proteobacterium symbiont of Bathyaustriella thionipta]MCU7951542.1 molecular chaperone HtpG [gamma proteobacterium symbiont of Bathyaustriella thionipta]MCU7952256.1 molecular chaperone HtpG [gamma proteobacterium symbiont of Bathyaustriella thionipta]MCU7958129.1 molecular chaperone HtpG [gamma proteobacterium symbiont of Bathyaustriella thionipta]